VISVVGIRGSLERATERKRYEVTISDSISAEDVGKFPDANIADSLQRVTGVQIDRTGGGEGRFVSVRGLNSQMNLTTYNGRVLASDNPGRDFSFDVMPTELLSRVSVYKTPTASQLDGSIGGLIELSSFDALSRPGFHFNASASGLYDKASSSTAPRFVMAVSNTFHDNTIGVFGGLSWYKRKWRSDTYEKSGFRMAPVDADGDGVKDPDIDGLGAYPGGMRYQVRLGDRERMTFSGGVNWKPNERLKSTVDAFYSRYETPEYTYSYNLNFTVRLAENRITNTTLVPWDGGGNNRWLITSFELPDIPLELGTANSAREVDLWQLGWNTRFEATDNLGLNFDVAYSVADQPANPLGNAFLDTGLNGGYYTYETTTPVPTVSCTLPDGRHCIDATNDEIGLHFMTLNGADIRDEVFSTRIDADWSSYFGDLYAKFQTGLFYSSREKSRISYASPLPCSYCQFGETFGQVGINAEVPFPRGGYRGGLIGGNSNRWPAQSADAIIAAAIAHRGQEFWDSALGPELRERESSWIEEDQYGAYFQMNLEGDDWNANAGLRYVRTDMTSRGFYQELLSVRPVFPGSINVEGEFSEVKPISENHVYGEWLPSFNLTWRLTDNLQLRGAVSRGIARPTFTQLGVDVNYVLTSRPTTMTRSGNPQLEPIRSDALDLSLEWYGDNGAAASLAGFYKDIDGFITQAYIDDTFLGEPLRIFNPINGDSATLFGLEFASQYIHPSGFGGQVNYTWVHSKSDVTLESVQRTTTLEGLSKSSWNIQAIYEKGPLAARLSYSWRDEYVSCQVCGPANVPITTADQGYLDFNASWQMNERIQLFVQAYNLTEEETHSYALDKRFTTFYEPYARRYEVGVRVSF